MSSFTFSCVAVCVASLYCIYKYSDRAVASERRRLRDRVAFMLWAAAKGGS